jgi:hypothetical protein
MLAKNKKYIVLIVCLFSILVVVKHYMPKPLNWDLSFNGESNSPYACRVMKDMLKTIFPEKSIPVNNSSLYISLNQNTVVHQNLIIITNDFNPDDLDLGALLNFIGKGNDVFISALHFADIVCDTLHFTLNSPLFDTSMFSKQKFTLNLYNLSDETSLIYSFRRGMTANYFTSYDTTHSVCLGSDKNGSLDYFVTAIGKGRIFLHCQPLAFTNYHLLSGSYEYACKALSYLPVESLIWDQYYKPDRLINLSPVRFILSEPALRSAYYLILISILMYMLFGSKRKQKIIPVITPEENTSLKFLITVGRLYYRSQDHTDLAMKKIIYFQEFLHNRYNFHQITDTDENIRLLTLKSGVDADSVAHLMHYLKAIGENQEISSTRLIEFHRLLENFYKKSK